MFQRDLTGTGSCGSPPCICHDDAPSQLHPPRRRLLQVRWWAILSAGGTPNFYWYLSHAGREEEEIGTLSRRALCNEGRSNEILLLWAKSWHHALHSKSLLLQSISVALIFYQPNLSFSNLAHDTQSFDVCWATSSDYLTCTSPNFIVIFGFGPGHVKFGRPLGPGSLFPPRSLPFPFLNALLFALHPPPFLSRFRSSDHRRRSQLPP